MDGRGDRHAAGSTTVPVALLVGVLAVAAASALLLPGLGHDAWAWMTWAREIPRLELDTTTGSTIKPLPMLLMAPVAPFGEAAPFVWLALSRAAFLLVAVAAWRLGAMLGGRLCSWFAAAGTLLVPVLFDASVNGYTESLTALAILCSIVALLSRHETAALALLATAGLMRPEAWPFLWLVAVAVARRGWVGWPAAVGLSALPPLAWAGLSWWGSGRPFGGADGLESIRSAGGVLQPLLTGVAPIVLIGVVLALVLAARERERTVLLMLGASAAWVAIVAVMAQAGFSGNSRYLVPAEVVATVASAWGLARFVRMTGEWSSFAIAAVAFGFAASAIVGAGFASDSIDRFRDNSRIADGMNGAIDLAGGRDRVLAAGEPIVMNWSRRTALAWQLDVPITGTQVIWGPDWTGSTELPAILIASPPTRGNDRAPLPRNIRLEPIGRSGVWTAYRASR